MIKNLKHSQRNKFGWKSQYFRKNFILILFITFIPGLMIGLGIYWFGVNEVEDSLKEMHENQIFERAQNIGDQFDYLEKSLSHWAYDPRFNSSLLNLNYVVEFQETRDIVQTLHVLQGSHPLIDHVELFVDSAVPVLFSPHYNVLEADEYEFYQSILEQHKNMSWNRLYSIPEESNIEDPQPLVLIHSIPGNSNAPFGSIIVTLDRQKVADLIKTLTPYNEGATFLLNDADRVLVSENSTEEASFVSSLRDSVLEKAELDQEGSFVFSDQDETYSVSYGTMRRMDSEWTYVSAAPMSSITSPIVIVSTMIISVSLIGLLFALILSWVASKTIYSPIAKLVKVLDKDSKWTDHNHKDEFKVIENQFKEMSMESQSLENRLTTQLPQLKNSFLLQLIQGYLYHYKEEELKERMQNYGWELDAHQFVVMDIQVLGLNESKTTIMKQDESLVAFALTNITEEVSLDYFEQCNVINFYDLSAVLLIVYPIHSEVRKSLHEFSNQVMDVLNRVLKRQITITISQPTESIKRIPYLFEDVRKGKRYRNFEKENQVIDLETFETANDISQLHYPFEIEKEILQAIRMGQINESEQLIREFIQELKGKGVKEINIQPCITQLFGSVQHEILHSSIHPYDLFQGKNMYEEISHIGDPEQMINWLTVEVITPFVKALEGKVNIEMKQLVEKVCTYIKEQYMEDISLESCAEEVHTNPYTLSKAFKKIMGVNFIDYVTKLRIEKAKELLLNTNMKMNDIAEQVGYRHSYFNRIFKKHIGIPPSQYRKQRVNDSIQDGTERK
ncbi:AraC family transcriptional regulator [Halalkalibacter sp. APA_J-10(15)]|uniref:AraC family transcriptional regulator n=1 Tax=Halalkalibacter sp. APA_J-10(15) TaxID=2933805 RepID=UPI001FF438F6|nr:AraC family transcriptional regulator [Halalkalibacter sp. APA_J-10(15)]MCK0473589.1 AraC family transcriptional regulator [Halalkalibacter sp. APA_J-10(15)]